MTIKMVERDDGEFGAFGAMPHDDKAEEAILGSILLDNALMGHAIELGIEVSTFYVPSNRVTWAAYIMLHHEGKVIDPLTLIDVFKREGQLAKSGGMTRVSELTFGLPHFLNLGAYARIVLDHAKVREALKVVRMSEALLIAGEESADEMLAQVEANTLEYIGAALRGQSRRSQEFVDVGDDEAEFQQRLVRYNEGLTDAIETPIPWLNDKLDDGGVVKQGVYVIAAPPKVGKTSLLLWFADFMAHTEQPGGLITLEMRRQSYQKRLFARYAGIPYWMMRKGFHGPEYERALKLVEPFYASLRKRLFMTDNLFTTAQFRHAARRLVNGPIQATWIALDYLQLASATANPDPRQRVQEVGAVVRDAKGLAQELDVPVIVISSLNQEGEKEGRRPELTDLAWSGQIRYDAEAIMFLHNPDFKRGMTREERIQFDALKLWNIDLILAAQRNGPTGEVRLQFVREYMQFNVPEVVKAPERRPLSPEPQFSEPAAPSFLTPDVEEDESWLD